MAPVPVDEQAVGVESQQLAVPDKSHRNVGSYLIRIVAARRTWRLRHG